MNIRSPIPPPNPAFMAGGARAARRPTGFVRREDLQMLLDGDDDDDDDDRRRDDDDHGDIRPSVLHRLYEAVTHEEMGPTLKNYK